MTDPDRLAALNEVATKAWLALVRDAREANPQYLIGWDDFDEAIQALELAWAEAGRLRLECARLRDLVARLEWPETLPGTGPWHVCPVCCNHRDQGHEDDCWLAAALKGHLTC